MPGYEVYVDFLSSSVGGWQFLQDYNPATPVDAVEAVTITDNKRALWMPPGTAELLYTPGNQFLLDGVLTDRLNPPAGFTITNVSVWVYNSNINGGTGGSTQLRQGGRNIGAPITLGGSPAIRTYIPEGVGPSFTHSVLYDAFGLIVNHDGSGFISSVDIDRIVLKGDYVLLNFTWYLKTHEETIGGLPAIVVDEIVAIDDEEEPPNDGFTYIEFGTDDEYPSEGDIPLFNWFEPVSQTYLEQPISPGPNWLLANVLDHTGNLHTDFALESSIVTITNPSGIYTLIKTKTHDTLYNRAQTASVNVAIPSPYFKTAYVKKAVAGKRRHAKRR